MRAVLDQGTKRSIALSNGAGAVVSDPIDLGHSQQGLAPAGCEARISAPVLTTAELPDGETMTYSLESDWTTAFSAAVGTGILLTQTGAGGAGAAAAEVQLPFSSSVARYARLRAVNSGAGNASGKTASVTLAF